MLSITLGATTKGLCSLLTLVKGLQTTDCHRMQIYYHSYIQENDGIEISIDQARRRSSKHEFATGVVESVKTSRKTIKSYIEFLLMWTPTNTALEFSGIIRELSPLCEILIMVNNISISETCRFFFDFNDDSFNESNTWCACETTAWST